MTLDKFLNEFGKVANKTKWRIGRYKEIRTVEGYCPICFLAKELGLNEEDRKSIGVGVVAESLGLRGFIAYDIVTAADTLDCDLRNKLIEITGAK